MLTLERIDAFYGDLQALHGVSLDVREGEIVALVGANAAGKTTTLRVISGTLGARAGRVLFGGLDLGRVPAHERVDRGIVQVPEGRRLFPFMTVRENLLLGAHPAKARAEQEKSLAQVLGLFPILGERERQLAGSLSGGEQQMCAIGRGLMSRPSLLLIDELSLGLAPLVVDNLLALIAEINRKGTTVLLVEQDVQVALEHAHRGYVLETGRIVQSNTAPLLLEDPRIRQAYLGL